jgi:hypothetical protein
MTTAGRRHERYSVKGVEERRKAEDERDSLTDPRLEEVLRHLTAAAQRPGLRVDAASHSCGGSSLIGFIVYA